MCRSGDRHRTVMALAENLFFDECNPGQRCRSEAMRIPRMMKTSRAILLLPLFTLCPGLVAWDRAVENLGVVERQAPIGSHAVSPGTERYPCRLLIGFKGSDGTWIVDLQKGSSHKAEATGFESDYLGWPSFIGADGKVFSSCARGGLSIYDPVSDTIKLVRPIPDARWLRGMAIGPDGAVNVSDYPTGSAAKYDPATGEVTCFGRQGGPFGVAHVYGYSVGCDGRYVYTAAGKMPWYVVAYDTQTGQQKNLLRFDPADHPEIHQRGDKVFLHVQHGPSEDRKPSHSCFQLLDGRVEPAEAVPRFDGSYVPGRDLPQPEIEAWGRNLTIVEGGAIVKYRMPGQDWQTAIIPVSGQDMTVERISPTADGRLLVSTSPYGNMHLFDPKSRSCTRLGNPASKNVYDMLQADGQTYFCGYPNGVLGSFGTEGATVLGNWHDSVASKHALFLVKGADGRIYSGNHNERESTGGALGWYDPANGTFGGIRFPNDDCEHLTTAMDGRYIVYASDFTHDPMHPEITKRNGKLLVYDTAKRQIDREVSPLSGTHLCESIPRHSMWNPSARLSRGGWSSSGTTSTLVGILNCGGYPWGDLPACLFPRIRKLESS